MEITSFNPVIMSNDAAPIVQLFEELGFERRHHSVNEATGGTDTVDMKNADGFRVDVAQSVRELPRDMMLIRMNVRDFDAAYQTLIDHGFKNTRGDDTVEAAASKFAVMVAPSGFAIVLSYHYRKAE